MGGIGAAEGRRRGMSWRGVGNGGSVGAGGENGPQAEPSGRTVPAGGARSGGGTLPGLWWAGTGGGGALRAVFCDGQGLGKEWDTGREEIIACGGAGGVVSLGGRNKNHREGRKMPKEMTAGELAERSLITKYRKTIWNRFIGGCKDYELIKPGDRIAVCISGGKDSMMLAKCMQHLQKYSDFPFEMEYLVMDPGYSPPNRELIERNARTLELPIRIFESPIFGVVDESEGGSPCYLCARMRRGYLYKEAQALGCNKIALGHHFNDVIETTLMSMLYGAEIKTMLPKLHSTNFAGMELIRPLYLVREEDIISWGKYNNLYFLQCACRFTERTAHAEEDSARREMKRLIAEMKQHNKNVDVNIFRSMHNVNLATAVGYRMGDDDEPHSFLEKYNEKEKM